MSTLAGSVSSSLGLKQSSTLTVPLLIFALHRWTRSRHSISLFDSFFWPSLYPPLSDIGAVVEEGGGSGVSTWSARILQTFTRRRRELPDRVRVLVKAIDIFIAYIILKVHLPRAILPVLLVPPILSIPLILPFLAHAPRPPLRISILSAAILAGLHEAIQLTLLCVMSSDAWTQSKRRLTGVIARGTRVEETNQSECAICLSTSSSSVLESFCQSCHTPFHRECLLSWWNEVQKVQAGESRGRLERQSANEALLRTTTMQAPLVSFAHPLPAVAEAALLRIIAEYQITTTDQVNTINISLTTQNTIRATGHRLPFASSPRPQTAWDLGSLARVIIGSEASGEGGVSLDAEGRGGDHENEGAKAGVTLWLDSAYVEERRTRGERWSAEWKSEVALKETMNTLRRKRGGDDTREEEIVIATATSLAPGPNCPLCRGALSLTIVLDAPTSTSTTKWRLPQSVARVYSVWGSSLGLGSFVDNFASQILIGGILSLITLARQARLSNAGSVVI